MIFSKFDNFHMKKQLDLIAAPALKDLTIMAAMLDFVISTLY